MKNTDQAPAAEPVLEEDEAKQRERQKPHYKLDHFEGPLDLLLFLIRKNEVNIYEIPIAEITEQYIQILELSTKIDLENITEFYVMATTLLYIKSRMLLPVEVDLEEELEDPRQELVAKLIEYQKYKKLSNLMAEKEDEAEWVVERRKDQRVLPFTDEEDMWEDVEVWDLLKCFSSVMSTLTPERIIDLYEEVSINEKISLIREKLETCDTFYFSELVQDQRSPMEVVCAFLAVLESVKTQDIRVKQNRLFGDIRIEVNPLRKEDAIGERDSHN